MEKEQMVFMKIRDLFLKATFSLKSSSPVDVKLTGCGETEIITDGNRNQTQMLNYCIPN